MTEWYRRAVPDNPADRKKLFVMAGAAVALVLVVSSLWPSATNPSTDISLPVPTALDGGTSTGTVMVHVVGAVEKPGVYEIPVDARVIDAVTEAGGLTLNADSSSVNLARRVQDGEQIIVARGGRRSVVAGSSSTVGGHISINSAAVADFETLPRIGPTLAERIVAYRDAHGSFASIDSLLDVPGIGEVTLAGFRDLVTL